jgi:DNA-binding transcriptional MerR regulator
MKDHKMSDIEFCDKMRQCGLSEKEIKGYLKMYKQQNSITDWIDDVMKNKSEDDVEEQLKRRKNEIKDNTRGFCRVPKKGA